MRIDEAVDQQGRRTIARVPLVAELLARRVDRDGAAPLITYYDPEHGERTELSATTFANWVAKTANLIAGELLLDPGDVVELDLARTHPGHWMTLVWELACWRSGTVVSVGSSAAARVMVCGPDWAEIDPGSADLVACALHPLGLGFTEPLPGSVVDYALEVRGQADTFAAPPLSGSSPAWLGAEQTLSQAELTAAGSNLPRRRLIRPSAPWPTAYGALIQPLLHGGSTVVVAGPIHDERLERIRIDERADQDD